MWKTVALGWVLPIVLTLIGSEVSAQGRCGRLVPCPQSRTVQQSSFDSMSNPTFCIVASPAATLRAFLGRTLTTQNGAATGLAQVCSGAASCDGCAPGIQILLHQFGTSVPASLPSTLRPFAKMGTEGYVLVVDKPGSSIRVAIGANTIDGLWNGAMTATQLLLRDDGRADGVIAAQIIQDYPDQPVRGAHWLDLKLGVDAAGNYVFDDHVREQVDFLRRHKINTLFYQEPAIVFHDRNWVDADHGGRNGARATRRLAAYCDSLRIDFVVTGGFVAPPLPCSPPGGGCDPVARRLEDSDGCWSGDQRFVFAAVNARGLQYNGSFELDWVDDGQPDGWETPDSRFDSYWAADRTVVFDGDVSMQLVQDGTFRPTLWQQLGVPDDLPESPPREYGLIARVWRRGKGLGETLRFRVSPRDSTGRIDASRQINAQMAPTPRRGWHTFSITGPSQRLLRLQRSDRALEFLVMADGAGVDTLRIDRLQLLPVVGGQLDSITDGLQEAVPGVAELLVNGDMEDVETVPSLGNARLPAHWWTSPQRPMACWAEATSRLAAAVGWQADSLEKNSGKYSARLSIPAASASSSRHVVLVQEIHGAFPPGQYRFTAWAKARWTQRDGTHPRLTLTADNGCGADTAQAWDLIDRNVLSASGTSIGWTFHQGTLTLTSARTRLGLSVHIPSPSFGDIWIDDVSLQRLPSIVPMQNLVLNGDMEACCDTLATVHCNCFPAETCRNVPMPAFWAPPPWACVSSRANGAAWSIVESPAPSDSVRSGKRALKLVAPRPDPSSLSVALEQEIPGEFAAGKYLLSAWGRLAEPLPEGASPPAVMLLATSTAAHAPFWYTSLVVTSTRWTRLTAVLPVPTDRVKLTVRARFDAAGSGTLYLDDVAVRSLDGSMGNVLARHYQPVVRDTLSGSAPYATHAYELRQPLVTYVYSPEAAPARILRRNVAGGIPPNQAVRIAYDQYVDLVHVGVDGILTRRDQGLNIAAPSVLETYFLSRIDALVRNGFPAAGHRAILLPPSEVAGFNRSGLERSAAGNLLQSNAERLAGFTNAMIRRARSADSTTVVYVWSDEWSPYHNGGKAYDQAPLAGPVGRTCEAITDSLLDSSARIVSWWYEPQFLANMTRSAQFFQKHGFMQLQATWCDTTNMTQAAALSIATPNCLGGVATTWPESGTDHRRDILEMVQRFWNMPWKQVYFADFNPNEPSSGVTTSGGVSVNVADTTLAMLLYPPGANYGAMRWGAGSGSLTLPDISVEDGAQYLLILHARGAAGSPAATKTIRVKPRWVRSNGGTVDGVDAILVVGGPGVGPGDFNRYTVRLDRPGSALGAGRLRVRVRVDASAGVVAADNLCVWQSVP